MKYLLATLWLVLVSIPTVRAEAGFFNSLDPRLDAMPASVIVADKDNFTGKTTTGENYSQYRIVSDQTVRIHKFTIGDLSFYISDHGVFTADNDLQALSVYFSLV